MTVSYWIVGAAILAVGAVAAAGDPDNVPARLVQGLSWGQVATDLEVLLARAQFADDQSIADRDRSIVERCAAAVCAGCARGRLPKPDREFPDRLVHLSHGYPPRHCAAEAIYKVFAKKP